MKKMYEQKDEMGKREITKHEWLFEPVPDSVPLIFARKQAREKI